MTDNNGELKLMVDASVLYYLEGKTQNEIAKELYISRPKVSRLLKKARDLGIVDININYLTEELEELQGEVRRTFNIENAVIVKTLSSHNDTLKEAGKAAAKELFAALKEGMTLGISWGKSVRMAAKYLTEKKINDVKIVELFGAFSYDLEYTDMLSIGRSISSKLGGKLYPLPAPIYIDDDKAREAIMATPVIASTLDMIENCDLVISGIGSVESESLETIWRNHVDVEVKDSIIDNGGVGFIYAHFFNEQGQFLDMKVNDNIIGIKTESIKNKRSIVVALGDYKAKAILGALRGGMVNTLISDERTIRKVLKLNKTK